MPRVKDHASFSLDTQRNLLDVALPVRKAASVLELFLFVAFISHKIIDPGELVMVNSTGRRHEARRLTRLRFRQVANKGCLLVRVQVAKQLSAHAVLLCLSNLSKAEFDIGVHVRDASQGILHSRTVGVVQDLVSEALLSVLTLWRLRPRPVHLAVKSICQLLLVFMPELGLALQVRLLLNGSRGR